MKKLVVLSVLALLIALPLVAQDVTIGGDLTYGFITDFDKGFGEDMAATVDIVKEVDEFITASVSINRDLDTIIDEDSPTGFSVAETIFLEKATIDHDLGAWSGLADMGVGAVLTAGYFDAGNESYQIKSGYENEDVVDVALTKDWELDLVLTVMDMVNIEVAANMEAAGSGEALIGAYASIMDMANAEVFYRIVTAGADQGQFIIDGDFSYDIADIALSAGVGFLMDQADDAVNEWVYGVGVSAGYAELASLGVGLDGNDNDTLAGLSADVTVSPIDLADLYAGMLYNVADSELTGIDLGVNLNVGAADIYLGYLVTDKAGGDLNAPAAPEDGGMYIKCNLDY